MSSAPTANQFITKLTALSKKTEIANVSRFFRGNDPKNKILGVRFGDTFKLARNFVKMPLNEIAALLKNDYYEVRMGAVSIMDFKARDKKITEAEKKALFELYIKRHDRINNWDLVDRSAPWVVGGYLADKPRKILYSLAKSKNEWERRTAIVSTWFFIRKNDVADTFRIARILAHDKNELVQKAVGSWLREAGKRDKKSLMNFLDEFAATMPRTALRYAVEKMDSKMKAFYLGKGSE